MPATCAKAGALPRSTSNSTGAAPAADCPRHRRGAQRDPEQWHDLLRCLKEHASIDYAYRKAVDFTERAKKPLYAFPHSSERDALLALPDYVLSRDR